MTATGTHRRELRILAPLDRPDEVESLAAAGAHELYAGVQPSGWSAGPLSATQRSFASALLPDEAALARAVHRAAQVGLSLRLTLNAPLYDPRAYAPLLALVERARDWGVSGFIVADLGLAVRLAALAWRPDVTVSTVAGCLNREALAFFRRFGGRRAVLPRHLDLAEVHNLVSAHPGLEFEVFVLVGRCPNEEGYCSLQHTSPAKRWPCELPYRLAAAGRQPAPDHPLVRWHGEWSRVDRRHGCALCAVAAREVMGVRYLKVVGRGGPTAAKVAHVAGLTEFLRGDRSRAAAREMRARWFGGACHPLTCYFPECLRSGPDRAPLPPPA